LLADEKQHQILFLAVDVEKPLSVAPAVQNVRIDWGIGNGGGGKIEDAVWRKFGGNVSYL